MSFLLHNCKETVENDCLYSQCFTSLVPVSDVAPHSVPVVDLPTMWCWSGRSKERPPFDNQLNRWRGISVGVLSMLADPYNYIDESVA